MAIMESIIVADDATTATIRAGSNGSAPLSHLDAARTAPQLRTYTDRTQRLYDLVRERMTRTQTVWGDDPRHIR